MISPAVPGFIYHNYERSIPDLFEFLRIPSVSTMESHTIDSLKGSDGKILIPGFYDRVRDINPEEQRETGSLSFDEGSIKARLGVHALVPRDSEAVRMASRAISYAFGTKPVPVRSGGTSEIVSLLKKAAGIQVIIVTGRGDPDDGEHSPDEHFRLENYRRGIIATVAMMYELVKGSNAKDTTLKGYRVPTFP